MSRHHVVISEAVAVGLQIILLPCFNHETGEFWDSRREVFQAYRTNIYETEACRMPRIFTTQYYHW